ncbi:glycosyltransferase [Pseudonocardia alni]|uniref:glycosyltransferase n=1 Tax=Pseudonocardia alni TaxID=33907 RepID=UPI0027A4E358|nr:glycosyltransferase [Pseudonocardia alni]
MNRMRVVYFVSPSQHFAGIERVVHEIATGLAEGFGHRVEVHVVYSSRYRDPALDSTAYTPHVLGVDRLRRLAGALREQIADLRPDVLVCPQVEASVIAWAATRGLGLPVLVPHLHGNPRIEETEGTRRTRLAFAVFRHLVSRRTPVVLAVSPSLARYAQRTVARHCEVRYVPNPVRPLPGAVDPPARPGDGVFRFVTVARLTRQKGQDRLLDALAVARPDLPQFRLTLVGTGDMEAELQEQCSRLGLDDVVAFTGRVSDPSPHLHEADCFVLPSRWEGFGLVLVEALQFGLPLLATDCEFGPADVIDDPAIGNLVPDGDVAALSAALVAAARRSADPAHAEARRKASRTHDRAAVAGAHVAVLDRLVTSAGLGR